MQSGWFQILPVPYRDRRRASSRFDPRFIPIMKTNAIVLHDEFERKVLHVPGIR
jgi:hypothetical protein